MAGRGDPRFHELLEEIGRLHDKKQEDYGTDGDPFANVRGSAQFGVDPWVGALVRLNDKVHRLGEFSRKGALANESAEDSMLDIAVYALIALILYREQSGGYLEENNKQGNVFQEMFGIPIVGLYETAPGQGNLHQWDGTVCPRTGCTYVRNAEPGEIVRGVES
jgi:hypothetical protein